MQADSLLAIVKVLNQILIVSIFSKVLSVVFLMQWDCTLLPTYLLVAFLILILILIILFYFYFCFYFLLLMSQFTHYCFCMQVAHFMTFYAVLWGAILYNGFTYFQVIRMLNNARRVCSS